jgi:predicted Fe-Mo cluster-binding NifX family protein
MRIAVSTDDRKNISYPLTRTKGFMIYDIEDGKIINRFYRLMNPSKIKNNSNGNILESGVNTALQETLKDCRSVITSCMGIIDKEELKKIDVEIFQSIESNVTNALEEYIHFNIKQVVEDMQNIVSTSEIVNIND